jgi:hypothetical protein
MTAAPARFSAPQGATPQWRKLGLKDGLRVCVVDAPEHWLFEADDDFPVIARVESGAADLVIGFARDQASVIDLLETQRERVRPGGALWIAWPRKAAGHLSDVSDETVRAVALDVGLVDVKVAALDNDWSALKLVWRLEHR